MFEGGDTLKIICEQVILPNLFLRDSATRRRTACDFLEALCICFESQIVTIYNRYICTMQKVKIGKRFKILFAQKIYGSFFRILTSEKFCKNEDVMRTVMRLSSSSLQDGVLLYLSQLMEKIVMILRRSSRNPNKSNFNNYLFKTMTVLICIIGTQNLEFVLYVLQTVGFLLESHSSESTLIPTFWKPSGDIPALSRPLQAFIKKADETIVFEKFVNFIKVLGIFQRLVSQSKIHVHDGFSILKS
ncbi:unnamed protein product [Rotaria sp. Silwood2]|nr:unnamed protein product [Rotaria sp. Silwood2]CAF3090677.1 unnamed protein product [Rotaria sp. Silwood2]CAF3308310.1 unnamed protein product [Rotaria sp. Silwood2]CAF4209747.1 unnamed protein product [Rotaria sp. Silwood2]CAF4372674.1 unnamed protein product [Rotaria sp. Silwood2]